MFSAYLDHGFALLIVACHTATALRLFFYQRHTHYGTANYQLHFSLLALLLIVGTGTRALDVVLHFENIAITPDQAGISLLLCVLVCRAKGNVAALLRGYP